MKRSLPLLLVVLAASLAIAVLGAAFAPPAPAAAAASEPGWQRVIDDWRADGHIDGSYSLSTLRSARSHVSSDQLQYSDLGAQLDQAIARAEQQGSGGGSTWWIIPLIVVLLLAICAVAAVVVRRRRPGMDQTGASASGGAPDIDEP